MEEMYMYVIYMYGRYICIYIYNYISAAAAPGLCLRTARGHASVGPFRAQ